MKDVLRTLAATVLFSLMPGLAAGQAWPSKPVRMIVPFAAAGTTDVVARMLAQKLSDIWNQSVVVENRTGAGGNIGADVVAKAAPDGYTLLLTSGAIVTASQYLYKSMPFDPATDLVPITNVATGPQLIAVSTTFPVKDLRELIAYAKSNPGRINFGSAGIGSQTHLVAENFAYSAGIELQHVPYKGESQALADLMGGQIQMATPNLAAAVAMARDGKIRALAVTSRTRNPQLPDVPSASDVLPDFESAGWFGLMAPAGTPREVIDKVYRDTIKVVMTDEFRAKLAQVGMEPVGNTPTEFAAAIRAQSARWAKIIKERGIKAD
jgi:tripartite-type tricarboxylate transporter receptor subunit TctC